MSTDLKFMTPVSLFLHGLNLHMYHDHIQQLVDKPVTRWPAKTNKQVLNTIHIPKAWNMKNII